jgi:hypothetical protein
MASDLYPVLAGVGFVAFGGLARWLGLDVYPRAYVAVGMLVLAVAVLASTMEATLFVVVAAAAFALGLLVSHWRTTGVRR